MWRVPVDGARVRAQRRLSNRVYPVLMGRICAQLRCWLLHCDALEFDLVLKHVSKTILFGCNKGEGQCGPSEWKKNSWLHQIPNLKVNLCRMTSMKPYSQTCVSSFLLQLRIMQAWGSAKSGNMLCKSARKLVAPACISNPPRRT
jgi:hypothetical protein